jgi:hypothetical protein
MMGMRCMCSSHHTRNKPIKLFTEWRKLAD